MVLFPRRDAARRKKNVQFPSHRPTSSRLSLPPRRRHRRPSSRAWAWLPIFSPGPASFDNWIVVARGRAACPSFPSCAYSLAHGAALGLLAPRGLGRWLGGIPITFRLVYEKPRPSPCLLPSWARNRSAEFISRPPAHTDGSSSDVKWGPFPRIVCGFRRVKRLLERYIARPSPSCTPQAFVPFQLLVLDALPSPSPRATCATLLFLSADNFTQTVSRQEKKRLPSPEPVYSRETSPPPVRELLPRCPPRNETADTEPLLVARTVDS